MAGRIEPIISSYYDPKGWIQIPEGDGSVFDDKPIVTAAPESTRTTICIATAERESARNNGEWTPVAVD